MSSTTRTAPKKISRLLVANRSEIAVRILRAAKDLGFSTATIFEEDDKDALHVSVADRAVPAKYMDSDSVIEACVATGSDAIHPGYGFLSESSELAAKAEKEGLLWVGPRKEHLDLFGDKVNAKAHAMQCDLPVLKGTSHLVRDASEAISLVRKEFSFPLLLKDPFGGGGRGIFRVENEKDIENVFDSIHDASNPQFFVEELFPSCKHIEVQVLGDGIDAIHLFDRDCSIQNQYRQKVVEIAPAIDIPDDVRKKLHDGAVKLLKNVGYCGAGTVEYLVDMKNPSNFRFLEVNPRLQVEHTITEEITGVDIVTAQLRLAQGERLDTICPSPIVATGTSIQSRLCLDGTQVGNISSFQEPGGVGIRVDSSLKRNIVPSARFDSLLSKIICSGPTFQVSMNRSLRALSDFHIHGKVGTNQAYLLAIFDNIMGREFGTADISTTFLPDHQDSLKERQKNFEKQLQNKYDTTFSSKEMTTENQDENTKQSLQDPIAPSNVHCLVSNSSAVVSKLLVAEGETVSKGATVAVLTWMKMDTILKAQVTGVVTKVLVNKGQVIDENKAIAWIQFDEKENDLHVESTKGETEEEKVAKEMKAKILALRTEAADLGAEAIAKQHSKGRLTIRERIEKLVDSDTFFEMGKAAKGNFVLGVAKINNQQVVVGGEDFTSSGGSPTPVGLRRSVYTEDLALQRRVPLIRLHEGAGGSIKGNGKGSKRSYDPAFSRPRFESVKKVLDTVPVASAALGAVAGLPASRFVASHFNVAIPKAQVLVAGPQIVERALGYSVSKEELGGPQVHLKSGVIHNLALDEADAFEQIARFLSFLPPSIDSVPPRKPCCDSVNRVDESLSTIVSPSNHRQVYDMRRIMASVMDQGSLFEVRSQFGPGIITSFARLNGCPVGVIANDCKYHGGALTADGSQKMTRFLKTLKQFSLPVIFFVDEPGFFIGVQAENEATILHGTEAVMESSLFPLPSASVVVRKAYGVAAAAHFPAENHHVLWPTASIGPLPVESGVAVAFKRVLKEIDDPVEREAKREELEEQFSQQLDPLARATNFAHHDIILPEETRPYLCAWIDQNWHLIERHVRLKNTEIHVSRL